MMRIFVSTVVACVLLGGCAAVPPRAALADLEKQVADTERGFAKSMADRDFAAFTAFLSDEAVFYTGPTPLRGKAAVAEAWKRFFDKPEAPFSWKPEKVAVLDSGTLALSTGPVYDPSGKHVFIYSSIWRLEAQGVWRIIFDKGESACDCAKPQ